jgi:hypothetical protein
MGSALAVLFALFMGAAQAGDYGKVWKKYDVPQRSYRVVDTNGEKRTITPSCSGGPVCAPDPATGLPKCRPGNTQYSFYYKEGKEKNLLVFFDGGGACWNSETCVKGNLGDLPAYRAELGASSDPANFGGVFDLNNAANPYRDWSMVVVPYCTGDIHWGSKDQTYRDETGLVTGELGGKVKIRHRGFDNFLYVREWMKSRFSDRRSRDGNLQKIIVTGSSAGGYGSAFAFPHVKQTFPKATAYLMADGANGVITDGFLDVAVRGLDSSWGMAGNLAHWIPGMDTLPYVPAASFANAYYYAVAAYYPNDRFTQYTTMWDVVQVFFYNTMLNQNNSDAWFYLPPEVWQDWVTQALTIMVGNSYNPNYRYYVGEGCNHTVMTFSDDFYKQSSNHPVQFLDWFKALTSDTDPAWQNVMCTNCEVPPTEVEANTCFLRSASR